MNRGCNPVLVGDLQDKVCPGVLAPEITMSENLAPSRRSAVLRRDHGQVAAPTSGFMRRLGSVTGDCSVGSGGAGSFNGH